MNRTEWKSYYLKEKKNFFESLGMSVEQILEKYKQDLEKLEEKELEWVNHRDRTSYLASCEGLREAIASLKQPAPNNLV